MCSPGETGRGQVSRLAPRRPQPPGLPNRLARALTRAQAQERSTEGSARRWAFRLTRSLIAGTLRLGYPVDEVAACLHVTSEAIRSRGGDEQISAMEFMFIAEVEPREFRRWRVEDLLPEPQEFYQASALIHALVHHQQHRIGRTQSAVSDSRPPGRGGR